VDFSSAQTTLAGLTSQGWYFEPMDVNCPGWTISSGALQVSAFDDFMGTCQVKLPTLPTAQYQQYNNFTLSVVQVLDLNSTQQEAQIMLGLNDPSKRLIDWATGTQPLQQRVYIITKSALPNGGTNAYQPLFQIVSGTPVGMANKGWMIESIAINATP
jgi:hypothetical protein